MKCKSKYLIVLLSCLTILMGILGINFAIAEQTVTDSYNIKNITDTDYLLNEDGTPTDVTIHDFAQKVKSANSMENLSDLTKIFSKEMLLDNDLIYQYNGKEYGIFITHRAVMDQYDNPAGYVADVMMIDLKMDITGNNQYYIKVAPILQETFKCYYLNGVFTVNKMTSPAGHNPDLRKKYYISNPVQRCIAE